MGEWWQHLPAEPDRQRPEEAELGALQGEWAQVWSSGDGSVIVNVTIFGMALPSASIRSET